MKLSELSKMDIKSLLEHLAEAKKSLFEMKIQSKTSTLEKPHLLKLKKREIANILTFVNKSKNKAKA